MTDWGAIAEQGKEPDTLEKIRDDITGALVPLIESMLPTPDEKQWRLILNELSQLANRADKEWYRIFSKRTGQTANFEWLYCETVDGVRYGD